MRHAPVSRGGHGCGPAGSTPADRRTAPDRRSARGHVRSAASSAYQRKNSAASLSSARASRSDLPFSADISRAMAVSPAHAALPGWHFEGTAEQHRTIFLAGPSNSVIEFKNYDDPRLQY
jgi:hypothetical protein